MTGNGAATACEALVTASREREVGMPAISEEEAEAQFDAGFASTVPMRLAPSEDPGDLFFAEPRMEQC